MTSEYEVLALIREVGIVRLSVLEEAIGDVQDSVRELLKWGLVYAPAPGFIAAVR
jgi:hypothetical protein